MFASASPGEEASGLELFGQVVALDHGWQPSLSSNSIGLQAPSIKVEEEEDVSQALVVKDKVDGEEAPLALTCSSLLSQRHMNNLITWNPTLAYLASLGQNLHQRPD